MPLAIDIAFKWGKKKPEEEKKDPPPTTTTSGSGTTTTTATKTTTACSTATNTDGGTTTTFPTGTESSNLKTLETGVNSKSLSKTADDKENEALSKTGGEATNQTATKTQSQTAENESIFKTGVAIDTIEDSNDDENETSTTTTTTTTLQPEGLQPESTQADSMGSTADKKKTVKTAIEKPKTEIYDIEGGSNESTSETETEESVSTATTQATDDGGSKLKTLETAKSSVTKPDEKLSTQRRVILFRHAERIDRVFPAWIRQSNSNGSFRPYNSNHPKTLPKRRGGLAAYESDPPITEIGKITAELAGKSLKKSQIKISAIFSSPALRCIETAQIIAKESGMPDLKIKIEYGLFDWSSFYEIPPTFLTTTELMDAGINIIAKGYRSIISKETFYKDFGSETKYDYYRRSHDIIHKILTSTIGTVVIIGHATSIDSCTRALLELPKSIPSIQHLDRLADRYPYCTSVVIEQSNQNGLWRLGKPLLPITFLNQTTKYDKQFLLRK